MLWNSALLELNVVVDFSLREIEQIVEQVVDRQP